MDSLKHAYPQHLEQINPFAKRCERRRRRAYLHLRCADAIARSLLSLKYQVIWITFIGIAGRIDCLAVLFIQDVAIARDLYPQYIASDDRAVRLVISLLSY